MLAVYIVIRVAQAIDKRWLRTSYEGPSYLTDMTVPSYPTDRYAIDSRLKKEDMKRLRETISAHDETICLSASHAYSKYAPIQGE